MPRSIVGHLQGWEGRWKENGLQQRELEAGNSREEVISLLTREFGSAPPAHLVEWFMWQDGSKDDWEAAPSGHRLLSLKEAILARRANLKVNASLDNDEESGPKYNERWLPITEGNKWERVFDVDTGHVYAFDWWDPETPSLISAELYGLLVTWMGMLDLGLFAWDADRREWTVDEDLVPAEWRQLRFMG